ncbi:MAG: NAD-dependent epimerase/dehydratase family protein [Nitrospiraceae bacterium]|nr:NAD-dependent epimerase/dehydratase family protein [Nitrospiraceae bacterium]
MKYVLVAGGAGFIGHNLVKRLLEDNEVFVVVVDNLYTGSTDNLRDFYDSKRFVFFEKDVCDLKGIDDFGVFGINHFDEVYNLACPASPKFYQKDALFTLKTNFLGTLNLLNIAKNCKAKYLQASTSEVYGDPAEVPENEYYYGNVNPVGERSCYDEGKRVAETMCYTYFHEFNVDVRVVRIFNTFGPFMRKDDGRVISNFIVSALNDDNLVIFGDGLQTRSFMFVDDLVDGFIKYMNKSERFFGPVNLGNPHEIKVIELAKMVLSLVPGTRSNIVFSDSLSDDPRRRKPCIKRAKEVLAWEPKVSLSEGLIKTLNYFKEVV